MSLLKGLWNIEMPHNCVNVHNDNKKYFLPVENKNIVNLFYSFNVQTTLVVFLSKLFVFDSMSILISKG